MHSIQLNSLHQNINLNIEVQYPNETDKFPVVLFVHGWNSSTLSASNYYQALTENGFGVAAADLRGHGKSSSHLNWRNKDFFSDLLFVHDVVKGLPQTKEIIVNGSSWGAYLSACLIGERNVSSLILRVPANYPDVFWNSREDSSQVVSKEMIKNSKAIKALKNFDGKILVVESGADEVIPHWMVETYTTSKPDIQYALMKGAPHALGRDIILHKQYLDIILPFLKK